MNLPMCNGEQSYHAATGNRDVVAYHYQGAPNRVITAVNTSTHQDYSRSLTLQSSDADSTRENLLTGETLKSTGAKLTPN